MSEQQKGAPLQHTSMNPLYQQMIVKIQEDISNGTYPPGSRIPSEGALCERYGVSRVTVRRALSELSREGILHKMQGKGTYVCKPRICRDLRSVSSFHEGCEAQGMKAGARLIHMHMTHADAQTASELQLPDERVLEIERLRMADDVPVMIETNRFPAKYTFLLLEDMHESLYEALERHDLRPESALHEISLCYATPAQAKLLEVEPGQALLLLHEVMYDQHALPLHTSTQVIRADRFTFRI